MNQNLEKPQEGQVKPYLVFYFNRAEQQSGQEVPSQHRKAGDRQEMTKSQASSGGTGSICQQSRIR